MRKLYSILFVLISSLCTAQLQFTDVASTRGAGHSYGDSTFGGGVSFVDFDGDGWDDLTYSTDENQEIVFLKNNGGTFSQVTFTGITNSDKSKQVLWVDYDNDGDKDFFLTNIEGQNKLYQNDGSMNFTDITVSSGIFSDDLETYGASFGDIDNDGDLDLFISNRGVNTSNRNFLYRNDNGVFVEITSTAGITTDNQFTFCSSFFDYDNDGDLDLYLANDKLSTINLLYRNNGDDTFTDVSASSGAGISANAMSTTIGDYNADGWFDIYVTNTEQGNFLLENNTDGTFTNKAATADVLFESFAWGAVFLDADNDSNLDIYVSGSLDGSVSSFISAAFYHNDGDGTFTIPSNAGFSNDTRESYANAVGDIDNDGNPDIVVMNDTDSYFLWSNGSVNTNNWIKIKLEGVNSNKDGVGNRIEIRANGKSQWRHTVCGEGYLGQNSQYEFVGVADATEIEYIKVHWTMSGQVETINNVSVNQAVTIQEGNGILSANDENQVQFSLYPNPSDTGIFKVNGLNSAQIKVEVYSVLGKKLQEQVIENNQLDLSNLASGIYMLRLKTEEGTQFKKVIKN